ncbi:uncharacterized protein LOC102211366 isoform X3 [Pundamilia nyererei]|uniref:Uncharacterized protein LOC102211366 isoform X3 n=1 Tax=Pundamilia nyererei TaxID=303518 RepID=A0A9Y6LZB1_9CICH|nr:PREDICTED: uncharacterized protein LOC102211366 isoform X3 [Pundamilia nyererei]
MMGRLFRICVISALLLCYVVLSGALEHGERKKEQIQSPDKNSSRLKVKGNFTSSHDRRPKAVTPGKKVKSGSKRVFMGPRSDISCTRLGGICQPVRYICQDRYLKDKCSGAKTRQCCMPVQAWSMLCAGHHNRVRACDAYGCGAFNSQSTLREDLQHPSLSLLRPGNSRRGLGLFTATARTVPWHHITPGAANV